AGRIENAYLCNDAVHAHKVTMINSVVRTERMLNRVRASLGCELGIRLFRVGPFFLTAHAMFMPAFHRAARARAFVPYTRPFVLTLCHFVKHAGTHPCVFEE